MDELETMTDAELDAELRSYGIDPEQLIQNAFQKLCVAFKAQSDRLSALQQSHDRLLGALKKAVVCDTCDGSKELECPPCCNCYGEFQCTHTGETIDCPACNGTGLNDMPDAIAAIAEATPEGESLK